MRIRYILFASVIVLSSAYAQDLRWVVLPNAPTSSKIDDLFFVDPLTGWAAVRSGAGSAVHKTTDGGLTWTETPVGGSVRSIRFTDANNGWVGSLTSPYLQKTTDGGTTWEAVTNLPSGPQAVCGLFALDSLHIFGVGGWSISYNTYFFRTTNGGASWTIRNMRSAPAVAGALVDLYFTSPDSGFVVGGSPDGATQNDKKALVLRTTNGGITWNPVYQGTQAGQLCWKITFPTPTTGYVSIEPFPSNQQNNPKYLKTTNGGLSWEQKSFPSGTYALEMQGIQFLSNGARGWVGGFRSTGYETTDGGATWNQAFGNNLNRFRMFGDTLGYASGQTIYKYTKETITSVGPPPAVPLVTNLDQNYPNPFNPNTTIEFTLNEYTHVKLTVHDALGREVATLLDGELDQGPYRKHWDARGFPSGTYFYRLVTPQFTETKRMVLVK